MRALTASVALVIIAGLMGACRKPHMTTTDDNKAFIREMLGSKKELTDYPDRFDPKIMMHEPQMLRMALVDLGRRHQEYSIRREHYPLMCDAVMEAMTAEPLGSPITNGPGTAIAGLLKESPRCKISVPLNT